MFLLLTAGWRVKSTQINPLPTEDLSVCQEFEPSSPFGELVQKEDTVEARWNFVRKYPHNHCFNYMRGNASTPEAALAQYDFVFVAERMDECEYTAAFTAFNQQS